MLEMQIAVSTMRGQIPSDLSLEERIKFAMRYVRKHEHDLFWMSFRVNDDMRVRTALAAVMIDGDENDRKVIEKSLMPLKMLNAAFSGIPVNFENIDLEGTIPIMEIWGEICNQSST